MWRGARPCARGRGRRRFRAGTKHKWRHPSDPSHTHPGLPATHEHHAYTPPPPRHQTHRPAREVSAAKAKMELAADKAPSGREVGLAACGGACAARPRGGCRPWPGRRSPAGGPAVRRRRREGRERGGPKKGDQQSPAVPWITSFCCCAAPPPARAAVPARSTRSRTWPRRISGGLS